MKINLRIKGQTLQIECGSGRQKIQWLGSVGIHRIDKNYGIETGMFRALQSEDGTYLNLENYVGDVLRDGSTVYVILQGEEDPIKRVDTHRDTKRLPSPPIRRPGMRETK